jgi:aminopeptidase N
MKNFTFIILFVALFSNFVFAQSFDPAMKGSDYCSMKKKNSPVILNEAFSQNSPKHTFDVLDYKLNLDIYSCFISPYSKSYSGSLILKFKVDSALTYIKLNAVNTSMAFDSIRLQTSNTVLTFSHSSDILQINMDRTYNVGEVVNVKIYYRHLNVTDNVFYTGSGGVFTDCEPEGARKWYPCWDKPSDKATFDITVKVPSTARLGSNGRLNDSTITGDTLYYHWVSRDPVATYLAVLTGKVNYSMRILYWHKLSNPADSIEMRYYYNSGENISSSANVILPMTTYFSQKFGEYPFEKGGFTTAPSSGFTWGGMENQTLITFCPGCWSANLTSHEYGHMWFGDMITCGTWADIWLNEGFATYCEALYYESTGGYSSYKSDIVSDASGYLSAGNPRPIYVPYWVNHTPIVDSLFHTGVTYNKGACVLHMLRYTLGDTIFFNALKSYGTDTTNFRYKPAVTADFITQWNLYTGQDLTWYFDEWIYQPAHPVYANTYNIANLGGGQYRVKFVANQTQVNTPFHKMPVTYKISFSTGSDTTIRVMNDVNNQTFTNIFYRTPTTLVFDPNNDIVLKTATLTVSVNDPQVELPKEYSLHQNYPNPFNPVTNIKYDIPNPGIVKITVYNTAGKEVSTLVNEFKQAGFHNVMFSSGYLSSGVYFYKIESGNFSQVKKMILIK